MLAPGSFSRRERAIIAAVSASAQDCTYLAESQAEWLRLGANPDPVKAIEEQWPVATSASARDQALCRIAAKLSRTPTRMGPDDWQPLIHSGVDPLGLLEVAYVVGLSNYMTRVADGFALSSDQPAIAGETPDHSSSPPLFDTEESKGGGAARRAAPDGKAVDVRKRADNEPDGEVSLGWFLKVRATGAPKDSPYNFGYRSEMGTLLSAHPRIGPAFWALFSEIMFTPGALTRAKREMLAAVAAAAQDFHY